MHINHLICIHTTYMQHIHTYIRIHASHAACRFIYFICLWLVDFIIIVLLGTWPVALFDLLRKKGFRRLMLRLFHTQCAVAASARCRFSRSYRIPAHQPARARHFCRPNVAIRAMSIVSSHERRSGVTLCVEGNISAGKSTFLSDIIEGSKILKVRFPYRPVAFS